MTHILLIIIYLAFISLGLPDGMLGAAWPSMYQGLDVPVSYAGLLSMIISVWTILSALFCEKLVRKFGAGIVTVLSVAMTAVAFLGFGLSNNFLVLCLWSIPYGFGAGSVDAVLNNFVALHYKSRHMSWLHCFWGVGCSTGPYIISYFLLNGYSWNGGYIAMFILQIILTGIIFFSLPLWKIKNKENGEETSGGDGEPLGMKNLISIKGVKEVMITFFAYCSLEQTVGLWAVSYVVLAKGMSPEKAAELGAVFYLGITLGRLLCGFITDKFTNMKMVRIGAILIGVGIFMLFVPAGNLPFIVGISLIGFGCAPVYPCLIHETPKRFGVNASQGVIGLQMASAYVGTTLMPFLFGLIADYITVSLLPLYLIVLFVILVVFSEITERKTQ